MALTKPQIAKLVGLVASSAPDELDCDGCLAHLAEFADYHLVNREVPDALKAVERHMQQCHCCEDEFHALMEGLREISSV